MEPLSKTERDESFMNHPFARIPGPPHAHGLLGRVAVRRTPSSRFEIEQKVAQRQRMPGVALK